MPLTIAERKHRMPSGAQREVARELRVDPSYVSRVMADDIRPKTRLGRKSVRRVQVAIARKLGMTVDEAFPPAEPARQVA
jgi:hypothetical protein